MTTDSHSELGAMTPLREPARTETSADQPARASLRVPIKAYVLSRAVVLIAALPGLWLHDPAGGPWPALPGGAMLARLFSRWDGAWYIYIAQHGYPSKAAYESGLGKYAFFPLFPMLVRAVAAVTPLSMVNSALFVSITSAVGATIAVYLLAVRLTNAERAQRAIYLFVLFPGSFVLSMAYAEALMIIGAAGCLLMLLNKRWLAAGLFGAVATAARPNGMAVVVACVIAAAVAIYHNRSSWKPLLAPLVSVSPPIVYFIYLAHHTGHINAWMDAQDRAWHDNISFVAPLYHRAAQLATHMPSFQDTRLNDLIATIGVGLLAVGVVLIVRSRFPTIVKAYTLAALAIPAVSWMIGPRPRMLFAAFPVMIALADVASRRVYKVAVIASAASLFVLTTILMTTTASTP
jgi:hypothetical protein